MMARRFIAITGIIFLGIAMVLLATHLMTDGLPLATLDYFGEQPGATVVRFENVNWQHDPGSQKVIQSLSLKRPHEPLLDGSNFSLEITGFLRIPVNGQYEFELQSDDGSFVMLDSRQILGDPGYHPMRSNKTVVQLEKGWKPLVIKYFNGYSNAGLQLRWKSPHGKLSDIKSGDIFCKIPEPHHFLIFRILSILVHQMTIMILIFMALVMLGLFVFYEKLDQEWFRRNIRDTMMPAMVLALLILTLLWSLYFLPRHNPVKHGFSISANSNVPLSFELRGTNCRLNSETHSSMHIRQRRLTFSGWVRIIEPGDYTLSLQADDRGELLINSSPFLISDITENFRVAVKKKYYFLEGYHRLTVSYFNAEMPAFIDLKWAQPGKESFHPVPVSQLYQSIPTVEERELERRFKLQTTILQITLGGFLVLFIWWATSKHRQGRLKSILRLTTALTIAVVLLRAHLLAHPHQAGFNWYLNQNIGVRTVILSGLFLLISGAFTPVIVWFRHWLKRHGNLQLAVGCLAMIMAALAQYCFTGASDPCPLPGTWGYVCAAMIIWLAGFKPVPLRCRAWPEHNRSKIRKTTWIFSVAVIAGVTIFLRFYRLHEMPPGLWWDEAQTGRVVQDILRGHCPPVYDLRINAGSLASWFNAAWCALVQTTDPWGLRSYAAAVGVITTGVSWFFYRQLFSVWWSLFGVALTAGLRWLFSINRVAMATIDETILLTFAVLALYLAAIRKKSLLLHVFTGILLGLAMHLHTGARVLPLIIGADMLVRFFRRPGGVLRRPGRNATLLIIAAVIFFMPMALHIVRNSDEYMARSRQTLLSTEYPGWYPVGPYLRNIRYYLEVYVYKGDWHPRHNYDRTPQLPPIVAVLAVVGCALSLTRFRRRREHRLLILGFCLVSLQGILTVHSNSANLNRIAENIPLVLAWAVMGAEFASRGIRKIAGKKWSDHLVYLLVAGVVFLTWFQEYTLYFHRYIKWKDLAQVYGFQPDLVTHGQTIRNILETEPETQVWAMHISGDPVQYMLPEDQSKLHGFRAPVVPDLKLDRPTVFVILYSEDEVAETIKAKYPRYQETIIPYSLNPEINLVRVLRVN